MPTSLPPELYYLSNFRAALAWISERYADLLSDDERAFIAQFAGLAQSAQALLVRMVMRQGIHFRASKLQYAARTSRWCAVNHRCNDWASRSPNQGSSNKVIMIAVGDRRDGWVGLSS